MALVKANHRIEDIRFVFDGDGAVEGLRLTVNYEIRDDVSGDEVSRGKDTISAWESLNPGMQTLAKTLGARLKEIGEAQ